MRNSRFVGATLLLTLLGAGFTACAIDDDNSSPEAAVGTTSTALSPDNRYILRFSNRGAARAAVAAQGGSVLRELPNHDAFAAQIPSQAVAGLSNNPNIVYIEPDQRRYPSQYTSEVAPYGISMVQADIVGNGSGASGRITACIIDSGYDLAHEDLPKSNVYGANDPGTGNWFEDLNSHGTHVAGTIAAVRNNGVGVVGVNDSSAIDLFIVKVFSAEGWAYSSDLVAALDVCTANNADVINMSLGGGRKSRTEEKAFKAALQAGALPIAAAGNDGNTRHSYPASYNSVMSVAAIDESGTVASFSQQTNQVEIAAPGVGVLSTVPMGLGRLADLLVGSSPFDSSGMDGTPLGSASGVLYTCQLDGTCPGAPGGHVCLIPRGTVSFSDKVLGCQSSGGVAAVIYNNEAGPLHGTLGGVATTILSVGVSQADGAVLLGQAGQTTALNITATNYAYFDGTSMATPHVVGVAALIWSHDPSWTAAQVREALTATAQDLGAPGRDNAYGHGLVQASAALDYLQSGPSCTPTETPETSCSDGVDNDCDGQTDSADSDCGTSGGCTSGLPLGSSCTSDGQCCSNKCKGRSGSKTCK